MNNFTDEQISGKVLDHLGLVASTIDQIGLVEKIDERLPITPGTGSKVSHGQRVSAMILNGLGFMDNRLYMFPDFLENKPVARLFGDGIEAKHFNDDALGRCLDAVYEYGITRLFSDIAFSIGVEQKLLGHSAHFDTTSLSVYGEYSNGLPKHEESSSNKMTEEVDSKVTNDSVSNSANEINRFDAPKSATATYGYSKDHRADLKQFVVNLATTGASGFPIWFEGHSGNASDKKILHEAAVRMQKFCQGLKDAPSFLYVADSAMYEKCVNECGELTWLTRAPEKLNAVKEMISHEDSAYVWEALGGGYRACYVETKYKGVHQRWCIISSEKAYQKEIKTLEKTIEKEFDAKSRELWHLGCKPFGCLNDAKKALAKFEKSLRYHKVCVEFLEVKKHSRKGRPKKGELPQVSGYELKGELLQAENKIAEAKCRKGRFVLATNELDQSKLPNSKMLDEYKAQSKTESGFRFIKDDTFEVDSIFLKKESRISALLMIMTLCLMVYSLAEFKLREALQSADETIPLPDNKKTSNPTLKRVFKLFHGVQVLTIQLKNHFQELVINLNDVTRMIVKHFGSKAVKIYDVNTASP